MDDSVAIALRWLKEVLDSENIEYQIVGGLAANIHGGRREVADIDVYIRNSDIEKILSKLSPFISKSLAHYIGHGWDLEYLQLIYQSQKIEIGLSDRTKIQSSIDGEWHELVIDYSCSVIGSYKGVEVPVIPIANLIEYKRHLAREVDLIDIRELESK
ncbi:mazG protein domain [Vibrio ishigakensis]|uniref:MazG protein domain n=1 Tax=Vibrio ishigakensis TaxID=1481914 RepID=A0A0B8NYT2_9VIBR|nr:MazG-related protein [Vibrio ishigakensis]GAM59700.1 mazG protein domain [Vibrio ishigakensis]